MNANAEMASLSKSTEDVQKLAAADRSRRDTYALLARLWSKEVDLGLWESLCRADYEACTESSSFDQAYRKLGDYVLRSASGSKSEESTGHGGFAPSDPSYNSPAFMRDIRPAILRTLAADFATLCRGVNRASGADPYESVHRNALGLMKQDEWEDVLKFYNEAGLKLTDSAVESEDYLGYELECMSLLCERGASALSASPHPDIAGYIRAVEFQYRLLTEHLLMWIDSFCRRVQESAQTDFYKTIAVITGEYLRMDADNLQTLTEEVEK